LIAFLGISVYLGIRSFGAQINRMSELRQDDALRQEALLSGKELKMKLTSTAFENGEIIPEEYTCFGADINPRLEILDIPKETESLVLIFDDPDAVGGVWNHWLVWNISPDVKTIGMRSIPKGANVGMNDFGEFGYSGPCPPSDEHRYMFRLFALDTLLDLSSSADRAQLEDQMEGHILAKTGLMGRFGR